MINKTSDNSSPETLIVFFSSGGHSHDGVSSTLIDYTKYSIFDFNMGYVKGDQNRAINYTNNFNNFKNLIVSTINDSFISPSGISLNSSIINADHIIDGTITSTELATPVQEALVPAGSLMPYAGATAPSGWLLCYGQAISRTTYAGLFAAISTTYGTGDGSTTFNLPDLRGRVIAGVDNIGGTDAGRLNWTNALGTVGGAQTHTLTSGEMPTHGHTIQRSAVQGAAGTANLFGLQLNSGTDYSTTQTAGSGGAHNNMQPTILMNYIIKT